MLKCFKNEKLWYAVGGAAAMVIGKKIITAKKTRELAVSGLAKGMKLQNDAKATFQNMKDEQDRISAAMQRKRQASTTKLTKKWMRNEISDRLR